MPKMFFPPAMRALEDLIKQPTANELLSREDCSDYIKTAVKYMQENEQTEADIMGHNLVYLHVNYNTYRLAFWVMDNLLENPKACAALQDEIDVTFEKLSGEEAKTGAEITISAKDLESMPVLGEFSFHHSISRISFILCHVHDG